MKALLASGFLLLGAAPGWAQMEVGAAVGPDMLGGRSGSETARSTATPLALALSLAIGSATWTAVGLSTSGTQASEIDRFVGRGYYRLEMIQTVLLAERSRTTLGLLDERREKGESLRDIAQSLSVDFDALYEEALRLEREVEARVRSLLRIDAVRPGKSP
ncbi:MAG: hypothetical protein AAB578_03185 [Elusimicrobiota bacterium]